MEALAEVYIKKIFPREKIPPLSPRVQACSNSMPRIQIHCYSLGVCGGRFPFSQIFGWKFWKLFLSNGKPFFFPVTPNLQFHWLIKKGMWWRNDGARRQQNGNGTVISVTNGWNGKKWSTVCLQRRPLFAKISV